MGLEQGFDLTKIAIQLVGTVPLWFFALAIFKSWQTRAKEQKEMLEKRLFELGQNSNDNKRLILDVVEGLRQHLGRIEMTLASQGVDELKNNIESLKEFRTETRIQLQAAFRRIDDLQESNG